MKKSHRAIVTLIDFLFVILITILTIVFRIYEQPFGQAVLYALAIGLAGGAVWLCVKWLLCSRLTQNSQ